MSAPPVLPPLKDTTQSIYRLEFAEDGFPGQREADGELVINPIFGKYAVQDFLLQAEQSDDERFIEAAAVVGRAAIRRMEEFKGGLVFWYGHETKPVRNPEMHYSGLTQSHYLIMFQRLAGLTGEQAFADAAELVLASLKVPVEKGGVLYLRDFGSIIAETPLEPNDVILNGWLTAMLNVWDYAELSVSPAARKLFDENLAALRSVIHLFDVPELSNSRYGSAGFAYFKLLFPPKPAGATPYEVSDLTLVVPDERPHPVTRTDGSRWQLYAFPQDLDRHEDGVFGLSGRALRLNLVLNYLAAPRTNELRLTVEAPTAGTATLQIRAAGYSPKSAAPSADPEWVVVSTVDVQPGVNEVCWSIGWDVAGLLAYPTSFLKKVGESFYNVYHFLHIDQLRRLHQLAGEDFLLEYAERWTRYVDEDWPSMDIYADVETGPSPHRGHPYR